MSCLHSRAAIDRPEVTYLTLPPTLEVVWQQPQETHLPIIHKTSTTKFINIPTYPNSNREMM